MANIHANNKNHDKSNFAKLSGNFAIGYQMK
jgi:hypothetical protein